jgi:hypothetical protein
MTSKELGSLAPDDSIWRRRHDHMIGQIIGAAQCKKGSL